MKCSGFLFGVAIMQPNQVIFNGVPNKFKPVITMILREWGELVEYAGSVYPISLKNRGREIAERDRQKRALETGAASGQPIARVTTAEAGNLVIVHLFLRSDAHSYVEYEYGRIQAQLAPDDKSFLTMAFEDGHQDKMQERWEKMIGKLTEQGWIKPPFVTANINAQPAKRIRSNCVKNVAFAIHLMNTESIGLSAAARRAHTHTGTINNRKDDPKVIEWVKIFKDDPQQATKMKQELAKKKQSKK
jgi:hypothetical protein